MTATVIDQQTFTIAFQRTIDASCDDVFDAWTQPEQISQWWDPSGEPLASCEIDLRPGGSFHFANAGDHPPFSGTYSRIDRPSRLEFDALGSHGTVILTPQGGKTIMDVAIRCASREHLEHFVSLGIATNTDRTLDNLVVHLERATSNCA